MAALEGINAGDVSGKVREVYDLRDGRMLIVTTDRFSAFDVILRDAIPFRGQVLNQTSKFWFSALGHIVRNHYITDDMSKLPLWFLENLDHEQFAWLWGRSMIVRKADPILVECIIRGYITGSGWKSYQRDGSICGIALPPGLQECEKLPQPLYTPTTKAPIGDHDENVTFEETVSLIGEDVATQIRDISIALYEAASVHALAQGVIIADTKFEFGIIEGRVHLIDEALTPDSSRFWPADRYEVGHDQPSFDKQIVRNWLEASGWDKQPPAPHLSEDVIQQTSEAYLEILERLTGRKLDQ